MRKIKFALCLLMTAVIGITSTAHADTLTDIKERKKLLVGIDLTFPPFGTLDANLKPIGSDVGVARMIAKDMGVELEIVQLTGPNRVPFLLTNKVDMVISSFSITAERKKVIDFSHPIALSESVILAPKSVSIAALKDLSGKRIGLVRGNLQENLLKPIAPEGMQTVRFDDDASNAAALMSGQVDGIGTSKELLPKLMKQDPAKQIEVKLSLGVIQQGIGIRKGDTALLNWTNQWVVTNITNGKLSDSYKENVGYPLPDMMQYVPK
jgi:polar amino acid transport system substrate-binding protein